MKKVSALIFLIAVFLSCQTAVKTAYGIKKPKLEDAESVRRYLVKNEVDTTHNFTYKDLNMFALASQMNLVNIPEAIFFNKQGNLVRYKKEAETCNAAVGDFITDLKQFSTMPEDKSITMDGFCKMLDGNCMADQKADVNVFITWAVSAGRLNKVKAFDWIHLLEKSKKDGVSVNYYLVNCDFQKRWNLTPDIKHQLGIKD